MEGLALLQEIVQDQSLPALKWVPQTMDGLSRAQNSIIIQLRSGHIVLNSYLHRITKINLPKCLSCKQANKLVHHFLLDANMEA